MSDDLHYLTATQALDAFRTRQLSPVELMTAVIDRADKLEGEVNALCERMSEEGMQAARAAERAYQRGEARQLEGLPVAAKEEHPIAGRTQTEGSLVLAGQVADTTHPIIDRIAAAGGIVHARTTTPEFSCAAFTHSTMWGITRNPWNLDYTPGGSSGGSGAALAAGYAPLATGSDIGGSIRIPSSFCGVVGFKPPYGRVPALAPFNLDTYCHDGPMARTVTDCALLQNVIAGPDPRDVVSLRPKHLLPQRYDDVAGMRIALSVQLGDYPVDPDVEANTRAMAQALRAAGAVVEEVDLPWQRKQLNRAAFAHFGAIFGPLIGQLIAEHGDLLNPYAKEFATRAAGAPSFAEGLQMEADIYAELGLLLDRYDALICPTTGIPGLPAGDDFIDTRITIAGTELDHYFEAFMTIPFNIASRCPVLSVPSGLSSSGLPTGLQIVAPTYDDDTVFRVGTALETLRPWSYPHASLLAG
jgi:aspartyl-tRNA(Asn)/glutamyl-tRNA(Gln) amidotransferase subunit A